MQAYLTRHETERTILRPLETADIAALAPFFEDREALRFFPPAGDLSPTQQAETWIDRQLTRYRENRYGLLAITDKTSGALLGMCGLLTQNVNGRQELEIGYHLLPIQRGKGLASEAAQYFKRFAFRHNLAPSVISIIHTENIASQRVAERNGMQRTISADFHSIPVYIYRIGTEEPDTESE